MSWTGRATGPDAAVSTSTAAEPESDTLALGVAPAWISETDKRLLDGRLAEPDLLGSEDSWLSLLLTLILLLVLPVLLCDVACAPLPAPSRGPHAWLVWRVR